MSELHQLAVHEYDTRVSCINLHDSDALDNACSARLGDHRGRRRRHATHDSAVTGSSRTDSTE
jgi:hypothetical protein